MAQSIADASMAAWVGGATRVIDNLPPSVPILPEGPAEPTPPSGSLLYPEDDDEPIIELPGLEHAARALEKRGVVTADEFYKLSGAAKQSAFTISGDLTAKSVDKIRELLADEVDQGASYTHFAKAVYEAVGELPIGEAHLEQVYRNAVNESFSQGMESVLEHPVVSQGFPYAAYYAIHDARARHEHQDLEHLGIDGTNVYYRQDPTWIKFRPPWSWGCRCGWTAISVKTAAGVGVREAQEWLETGIEPAHPYVTPPPFNPPPGWDRVGIAA